MWRTALLINLLLAGLVSVQSSRTTILPQASISSPPSALVGLTDLRLKIAPPAYTGIVAFESEAKELTVPEQSVISWCLPLLPGGTALGANQEIRLSDGQTLNFDSAKETKNVHCITWVATEKCVLDLERRPKVTTLEFESEVGSGA